MLSNKSRSIKLGPHATQLIPNLCFLSIRSVATPTATSTATATAPSAAASPPLPPPSLWSSDPPLLSSVLSLLSGRTIHFLQLNGENSVFVLSRSLSTPASTTATDPNSDIRSVQHLLSKDRAPTPMIDVTIAEPCALLSSPPAILHLPSGKSTRSHSFEAFSHPID